MNFTLKATTNDKTIQRARTHSLRRFSDNLRTINWQNGPLKVYLRVNYDKREDCHGKMSVFYNDGTYQNEKDLWLAFNAFKGEV